MRTISSKITSFCLLYLPIPLKNLLRKLMPISIKRSLGSRVMEQENTDLVVVDDGRKFIVIKDRLFLRVLFEKNYEPLLSSVAEKLIKNGDNIVDVGANFGWYTTLFSLTSQNGKVICYEPAPHSYKILEQNIVLNNMKNGVDVRKVGVGAQEGSFLMEPGSVSESGLAHVVSKKSSSTIEVEVVTLDNDLRSLVGTIAYIKFDIEGFEHSALKGAESIINTENQPIIQIELNEEALQRAGSSRNETLQFLKNHGYTFYEAIPNSPGKLTLSNGTSCSDIFCFGKGKYAQRLTTLLIN